MMKKQRQTPSNILPIVDLLLNDNNTHNVLQNIGAVFSSVWVGGEGLKDDLKGVI